MGMGRIRSGSKLLSKADKRIGLNILILNKFTIFYTYNIKNTQWNSERSHMAYTSLAQGLEIKKNAFRNFHFFLNLCG